MSYCINPSCPQPNDPANTSNRICRNCGSELLLQERYQVMRLLSDKSGFGKVYEAYRGAIPKILKVLKQFHNDNPRIVELFQQEAAVLSQLNHPGIPRVEPDGYFQFFPKNSIEPVHCIIMEKIDGLNLKQWMRQQGNQPIAEKQALNWLKQLAEILHLVHQKNYFHRDIKPENIMLRSNGQLVLIDFGTARELTYTYLAEVGGSGSVTKISSAGYTPPEQEKGHAVPQSDFYALGRTFVYLMTTKQATDPAVYNPLTDQLSWRDRAPHISSKFADFIDRLMAPTAAERPKNTQEMLETIGDLLTEFSRPQLETKIDENTLNQVSSYAPPSKTSSSTIKLGSRTKTCLTITAISLVFGLSLGYRGWIIRHQEPPYVTVYKNISLARTITGHSNFVNYLAISPDGEKLVSASADKTIKLWDLATGKEIRTLIRHSKHINYFAISPDLQTIASGSGDRTIKIWDFATGKEIRTLTGHFSFVNDLAISPDGQTLVSASADKAIKLWNLATGKEIHTLTGHSSSVNYVTISADGRKLVSASADKTIKIWDFATGKEIRTLTGHSSFINSLAISPDGETIVSASADKTIKLWNIATGKEIRTLSGHSSPVKPLAISPDGQILVSGSVDKTIKLWELATGKEIRTLTGHTSSINSVVISPDGETVVSASADKTIKIWRMPK